MEIGRKMKWRLRSCGLRALSFERTFLL